MQQTWTCDTCHQPILKTEEGWIEWWIPVRSESSLGKGLRLVHHSSACPYGPKGSCHYAEESEMLDGGFNLQDFPLDRFLGADGLMFLLSLLAEGRLPKEEVLEMIKRLHITGYEQARPHFERAISSGVIGLYEPAGYYRQSEIQSVLKLIEQEGSVSPEGTV